MARNRRKKSKKTHGITAEDIASGRVHPTARQLIEAIHAVNPTNRDGFSDDKARRYQLKSRLQSLLLERYKEDIAIRLESNEEGVVLLVHRTLGLDACHAVIDELDIDARAWVLRQIDTGATDEALAANRDTLRAGVEDSTAFSGEPTDSSREADIAGWLARGRKALDEYDYDDARLALETAWSRDPRNVAVATALLEFLVDHMGAYEEALEVARDPRVTLTTGMRVLGALAAARAGRFEEAAALASGVEDKALAEAWLLATDDAIKCRDWDRAAALVDQARPLCVDDSAVISRTTAIDEGRADERAPHEAAVEAMLLKGRFEEAEQGARALLERWPDSKAARHVLAAVDARHRERALAEALRKAESAIAEGDHVRAIIHLNKAVECGGDKEIIRSQIAASEQVLQATADDEAVARVLSLLEDGAEETAALGYLDVSADLKQRIRSTRDVPVLQWIDQLVKGECSKRTKQNIARAVCALSAAEDEMNRGSVETAARLIRPFGEILRPLAAHQKVVDAEADRQALSKQREARDAFEAFRRAFLDGRYTEAEVLGNDVRTEDLGEAEKSVFADLASRLTEVLTSAALESALADAEDRGDLFQARSLARELRDATKGDARATYEQKQRRLDEQIQRAWRVWRLDGAEAAETRATAFERVPRGKEQYYWLSPDGDAAAQGWARGRWLFYQVVDINTGRLRRALLARGERPMKFTADSLYDGRVLSINDAKGVAVRFDTHTGEVADRLDFRALLDQRRIGERALLLPGGDHLFLNTSDKETRRMTTKVLDLKTMRLEKDLGDQGWSATLLPLETMSVGTLKEERECLIFSGRGFLQARFHLSGAAGLYGVQLHPDGERLVLLATYRNDDEDKEGTVYVVAADRRGNQGTPYRIDGCYFEFVHQVVTTRDPGGLVFVEWADQERQIHLLGLEALDDGFGFLFDVPVPRAAVLIQDVEGRHAVAIAETSEGAVYRALGRDAPNIGADAETVYGLPSPDMTHLLCAWPDGEKNAAALAMFGMIKELSSTEVLAELEDHVRRHAEDPDGLLTMAHALGKLRSDGGEVLRVEYISMLADQKSLQSDLQLVHAVALLDRDDWNGAASCLELCDPADLLPENLAHYYHLRGAVAYHTNDIDEARRCFEELLRSTDPCTNGADLLAMVGGASVDETPGSDAGARAVAEIHEAIRAADCAMAAGDIAAARRALDTPVVWHHNERQSLTRLCFAFLRSPALTKGETFRMVFLMANLVSIGEEEHGLFSKNLHLGGSQWDDDRIKEVMDEAAAWLESWTPPR
jgi:tetratricopeptide (TPR) repeat protein